MRKMNKKSVIEAIYNDGPISRIDISQHTGLTKATVSSLVDELITDKYVEEIGFGASKGGRKPVMLQFQSESGYCVGVDVQITYIKTILTDMRGNIVYRRIRPLEAFKGHVSRNTLEQILITEIQNATEQAPSAPHGIVGTGIALPGMLNFRTGVAYHLPNIEIRDWDVISRLREAFPFPIFIDNDGNCGAWSEYRQRHIQHLVFISCGTGIGTGIVLGGQLYRGVHGIAGEFGHMTISPAGVPCACGNDGCWEQYASEQALLRYLRQRQQSPESLELSPDLVSVAVERAADNEGYRRAFQSIGSYLGIGISNIVNAFNPELIVIGGTMAQGYEYFIDELCCVMKHRAISYNKDVPVMVADADAIVIGAARLAVSHVIFERIN